jgi:hypothetical protein
MADFPARDNIVAVFFFNEVLRVSMFSSMLFTDEALFGIGSIISIHNQHQ